MAQEPPATQGKTLITDQPKLLPDQNNPGRSSNAPTYQCLELVAQNESDRRLRPKKGKRWIFTLLCSVLISGLICSLGNQVLSRQLRDLLRISNFTPSAEVGALSNASGMSPRGRYFFFVSNPKLGDAKAFNRQCPTDGNKEFHLLGCYKDQQIAVLNVKSQDLKGINEVSAAHEMLHAAWDRLGNFERDRIGKLLEDAYAKLDDAKLKNRLKYYQNLEPGQRSNELHSILGTEKAKLNPELESYYSQYFTDRKIVVALNSRVQGVFDDLDTKIKTLDAELDAFGPALIKDIKSFNDLVDQLNKENASLDNQFATLNRNSRVAIDAYNSRVDSYNSRLDSLRSQRAPLQQRVAEFEQKTRDYNALVAKGNELNLSISSRSDTLPKVS